MSKRDTAEKLTKLREDSKLSISQVCKEIKNVSIDDLEAWENCEAQVPVHILPTLLLCYGCKTSLKIEHDNKSDSGVGFFHLVATKGNIKFEVELSNLDNELISRSLNLYSNKLDEISGSLNGGLAF